MKKRRRRKTTNKSRYPGRSKRRSGKSQRGGIFPLLPIVGTLAAGLGGKLLDKII